MPTVTARLVSEEERFGVTVRPPVEELQGRLGWDSAINARVYRSHPIVPGTWEVTVTHNDWNVTTSVEVGKAWRSDGEIHGTATKVRVEVGSADVSSETVDPQI